MKTVFFNSVAVADLEEIVSYITQDSVVSADNVRLDIFDTAESLGHQPGLGVRPRFSAPRFTGIRFVPSQRYPTYLLFYRELPNEVEVLRVLHGSRNLPSLFE
jgi:toxin ParE1/3/4